MNSPILISTLFLTILLTIGLFFFIRASVKDRTQQIDFTAEVPPDSFLDQLQNYFTQRAYHITQVNPQQQQITFEGFVRPSLFLAIFLTFLTALGLLCLSLVLSLLYPNLSSAFLTLTLISPIAGIFYWKKAGRIEKVSLQVKSSLEFPSSKSMITITAHRDELRQLQEALAIKVKNET